MATIGIIGMLLGTAASAWGAELRTQTIQVPGNQRIHVGSAMSFFGGLALSLGGTSLFLSLF